MRVVTLSHNTHLPLRRSNRPPAPRLPAHPRLRPRRYAIVRNIHLAGCERDAHGSSSNSTSVGDDDCAVGVDDDKDWGDQCRTDVIGDVTPFEFTYPYPFFLDSCIDFDGLSSKVGTIIVQGLLLAIAGIIQASARAPRPTRPARPSPHAPPAAGSAHSERVRVAGADDD